MDGKKSVFSVSAWTSELGVAGPYHACVANMGAADKSCPAVEFVAPAWLAAVALRSRDSLGGGDWRAHERLNWASVSSRRNPLPVIRLK